jgi:hypothetical protein
MKKSSIFVRIIFCDFNLRSQNVGNDVCCVMCTYVAFVQVHLVCLLMVLHACALTCDPVASGSGLLPLYVIIQSISHSHNKPTDRHSIDQAENFVRMYSICVWRNTVLYCFQRQTFAYLFFPIFVGIIVYV